ncbi:hypothetical protein E2C01_019186 [Portunus trituberculatus]|uniref:Uncharacterized protein n=1 Tax=Portunus trituberculatus TaxID=210409 RepID=A0A5B7DYI0_PORTR|nr:hypothetical protein [Portunus trituberculatus]
MGNAGLWTDVPINYGEYTGSMGGRSTQYRGEEEPSFSLNEPDTEPQMVRSRPRLDPVTDNDLSSPKLDPLTEPDLSKLDPVTDADLSNLMLEPGRSSP